MLIAEAVRAGWRAVRRSKRLLGLTALADLLVCVPAALYVGRAVHDAAGRRPHATELARHLDPDLMFDLRARTNDFDADLTALVVAALVLFFAVRPIVAGGFVGIAAAGRRISFAEFVREGGAHYWKFLRVALAGVCAVFLLSLAAKPLLEFIDELARKRPSELSATAYQQVVHGVVFVALGVVACVVDYTRVGIRMRRRRRVLAELGRSALFVLQHPVRTLGFFGLTLLAELALVAAFAQVMNLADGAYLITSAVMLALLQTLVLLREALRLFHTAGAWQIRHAEDGDETRLRIPLELPEEPDLLRTPLPWHVR